MLLVRSSKSLMSRPGRSDLWQRNFGWTWDQLLVEVGRPNIYWDAMLWPSTIVKNMATTKDGSGCVLQHGSVLTGPWYNDHQFKMVTFIINEERLLKTGVTVPDKVYGISTSACQTNLRMDRQAVIQCCPIHWVGWGEEHNDNKIKQSFSTGTGNLWT